MSHALDYFEREHPELCDSPAGNTQHQEAAQQAVESLQEELQQQCAEAPLLKEVMMNKPVRP